MNLRNEESTIVNNKPAFDIARDKLQEFSKLNPNAFCKVFGHRMEGSPYSCPVCGISLASLRHRKHLREEIYTLISDLNADALEQIMKFITTSLNYTSLSSTINLRDKDEPSIR
jgi:hypothetical protein